MITQNSMRCLIKGNRDIGNAKENPGFAAFMMQCTPAAHLSLHLSLNLRT